MLFRSFTIAHDPTQVDRQGPDVGPQYRSVVFAGNAEQARVADSMIAQLAAKRTYPGRIVTEIGLLGRFREAGEDQLASHGAVGLGLHERQPRPPV